MPTLAQFGPACLLVAAAAASHAQTITSIGVLLGHTESSASGINSDGSAVCGTSADPSGLTRAVRWTSTDGIQNLGTVIPSHATSFATGISDDGQIVVGGSYTVGIGQPLRAFRWTSPTGMVGLPAGTFHDEAFGVSPDGSAIFGQSNYYAARWTNNGATLNYLGDLQNGFSYAIGSNTNGSIIGGYGTLNSYRHACLWVPPAAPQDLGILFPNNDTWTTAMSRDGSTMVGFTGYGLFNQRAMKWTQATGLVDVGLPSFIPNDEAVFSAVTSEGITSLGWATYNAAQKAVHWTEVGGFQDLNGYLAAAGVNLTGWDLTECTGVSADARALCGNGLYNGQKRGWVVRGLQPVCGALVYGQPTDIEACAGSSPTMLTVAYAPTFTGIIKYQWARVLYINNNPVYIPLANGASGNGSTYSGVKTPNWNIAGVQSGDAGQFVCLFDAGCGQTVSKIANLTVIAGPPAVFFGPSDQSVCSTANTGFGCSATLANTPHSYQWECENPASSNTWVPINAGSSLTSFGVGGATIVSPTNAVMGILASNSLNGLNNRKVRCAISNACGTVYTNTSVLKVCLGDDNCDGFVDDGDFVNFALAYDLFDCADPNMPPGCPADLNFDGFVDDADFVLFANAYDALVCP